MNFEKLDAPPTLIGESPVWDDRSGRLFWIDGRSGNVSAMRPGRNDRQTWKLDLSIGSIGLADGNSLLLSLQHGFYLLNLAEPGVELQFLCEVPNKNPLLKLNDGKMDRAGRFVCTEWAANYKAIGSLYRLTYPDRLEKLSTGIRIGNGVCFSPSGERMYYADSVARKIFVCPYDQRSGAVGQATILFDTSILNSSSDGATVDSEGYLWVALVHLGRIARIAPTGELDRVVQLPVDYPSCPAFGGDDFGTLFVTSIKDSGTGHTVSTHPDGGCIFAVNGLGVQGLPEPRLRF